MLTKRNSILTNVLIFVIIPLSYAKIFIITFRSKDYDPYPAIRPVLDMAGKDGQKENQNGLLESLMALAKKRNEDNLHKCRLFGSVYGTRNQRLECQKKCTNKKTKTLILPNPNLYWDHKDHKPTYEDAYYYDGYLTDIFGKDGYHDMSRSFSTDIDMKDLRSENLLSNTIKIKKRNMNIDSSDEFLASDDDSDEIKEPKRFQVINNKKKPKLELQTVSDSDDSSSQEYTPPVRNKKEKDISDSDSSSEEIIQKPTRGKIKEVLSLSSSESDAVPLKAKKTDEHYLLGHRIVGLRSKNFRKKFLPKRFFWEADDIHNLGYYWFNGPQGKYPLYSVRP